MNCSNIKKSELKCRLLRRVVEKPGAYHLETLALSPTRNRRPSPLSWATQKSHLRCYQRNSDSISSYHANRSLLYSPGWENHWKFPNTGQTWLSLRLKELPATTWEMDLVREDTWEVETLQNKPDHEVGRYPGKRGWILEIYTEYLTKL